jgi:hypothetical protein
MSENPTGQNTAGDGYDPTQDPDADPAMMPSRHPDQRAMEADPAEGPDDEAATDG